MLGKFFFKRLSISKQVDVLKTKGIMLGTRIKEGRNIYIYMLRDFFVEVCFKNDNADDTPEKLTFLNGLKDLNNYLENEFKSNDRLTINR